MSDGVVLYDGSGRVIEQLPSQVKHRTAFRSGGYDAAGGGRRALGWEADSGSAASIALAELDTLRTRSRDQVRKNPWAENALSVWVSNCVGTGIKPSPQSPDDAWNADVRDVWRDWTQESDIEGMLDFDGQLALTVREMAESGEHIIRFRTRRPEDGLRVPLQLQLVESEQLPATLHRNLEGGRKIRSGVEFDAVGRRVRYHLLREHPGDYMSAVSFHQFATGGNTVAVPADSVIHCFKVQRSGQVRGFPWLSPVLSRLYDLDITDDAWLKREQVAALFSFFLRTNDSNPLGDSDSTLPNDGIATDRDDLLATAWEAGTGLRLDADEEVQFSNPPQGGDHTGFVQMQLRAIAAGLGITYEQLTGDLTGVSFSSIRQGALEFRRRCEQFQQRVLVYQICRRVYRRVLETAMLSGALRVPTGFRTNSAAFFRASWQPNGWKWIDPEKEVKAAIRAIRGGLTSRARVVAEQGIDVAVLDAELAAEREREAALGLVLDTDAARSLVSEDVPTAHVVEDQNDDADAA